MLERRLDGWPTSLREGRSKAGKDGKGSLLKSSTSDTSFSNEPVQLTRSCPLFNLSCVVTLGTTDSTTSSSASSEPDVKTEDEPASKKRKTEGSEGETKEKLEEDGEREGEEKKKVAAGV